VSIDSLSFASAGLAFVAGLVSFFSPCVLPLLPVYLSYVSGVAVDQLEQNRWRVVRVALAFTAGFTVLFVVLGTAAGSLGEVLTANKTVLSIVAGVVLIIAGLFVMDVFHVGSGAGLKIPRIAGPAGAFVTGAVIALGWTPCVGPVLGAILTLAGTGQSAAAGGLLLFIYSLGLAVPFLAAAAAFGWVGGRIAWVKRHYRGFRLAAGILLIVAGLMMVTGTFEWLSRAVAGWQPFEL
jgi:cytochrome c-type biogenesis protein